jgi:hypothetical protein
MFNLHVSSLGADPVRFPSSASGLPDDYAKLLFRMSSQLPELLVKFAQGKGVTLANDSRGFTFNAEAGEIVEFFEIGTVAAQMR